MSQKWSNKTMLPRDNYILRVVEESFGPSKGSGNPMITLEFEVVSPEEVEVGGDMFNVAGVKTVGYYTTQVFADAEGNLEKDKTENAQKRVRTLYERFGLPSDNINFENPVLEFKGKTVHALLYSDVTEQRKAPTKEQLAKGQRQGDVIKNPITGKPLVSYYPKIDEIFGLAQTDPNKPF